MQTIKKKKVAIVHYWWLTLRGGESVVIELLRLYPDADLFIHVADLDLLKSSLPANHTGKIFFSFINSLPFSKKIYQKYLFLMPIALEQLDLRNYDLIISSESGPAKGVISDPTSIHICYCHSPMRYIWDLYLDYYENSNYILKVILPLLIHKLRIWDVASSLRVDHFIANSTFVSKRINKFYRRKSTIIFPPVDCLKFNFERKRKPHYLYLGQLTRYKRPDIAIEVFNILNLPLIVIGEGEMEKDLKSKAGSNIIFLGRQSNETVQEYLETCRALIFPGIEDFGIVPVEAMAAGTPVVAFNKGGALDTIVNGLTGLLVDEQTSSAFIEAVLKIENKEMIFNPKNIHDFSLKFDKAHFSSQIETLIDNLLNESVNK